MTTLPTSSYRPAYSQVLDIPHHFPGVPVMALSATVTPKTLGLLQEALPASVLVKSSANRPNIFLEAHEVRSFYNSRGGKSIVCNPVTHVTCMSY